VGPSLPVTIRRTEFASSDPDELREVIEIVDQADQDGVGWRGAGIMAEFVR